MIRTRSNSSDTIAGDGDFIIAMSIDELILIASLLGMVKLGQRPYQIAALNLMDSLEELTADKDFTLTALSEVQPTFEVLESTGFTTIAEYDETYIVEISV